jgi:hypothetical protein
MGEVADEKLGRVPRASELGDNRLIRCGRQDGLNVSEKSREVLIGFVEAAAPD